MVSVSLQLHTFQNKFFNFSDSKLVGEDYVKTEELESGREIIYYDIQSIEKVNDNTTSVKLVTEILIPRYLIYKEDKFKNSFYAYHCQSEFYTNCKKVDSLVISELFLSHESLCLIPLFQDILSKTENKTPYNLTLSSLSKILLQVESLNMEL